MVFGLKLGLPKKGAGPAEPPCNELTSNAKASSSGAKSALTVNEFVARTKRCREKGLEPTKPELIAYARYLGIDPIVDGDLMWIADEALNAPLPSEWTEHHDSADRVFYYNVQTHASSWTHPLEQLHRDTYKCIVNFRSGELSKEDRAKELEKLRRKCEEAEREAHRELQAWSEHTDDQGQKFYYNREQQRSVWTDPRPARCHALYLQMKALRVLSKQAGQQSSPTRSGGGEPLLADMRGAGGSGGGESTSSNRMKSFQLPSNSSTASYAEGGGVGSSSLGGGGSSLDSPARSGGHNGGHCDTLGDPAISTGEDKKRRKKRKDEAKSSSGTASSNGGGGAELLSGSGGAGGGGGGSGRRGSGQFAGGTSGGTGGGGPPSAEAGRASPPGDPLRKPPLDLKKPPLSAVEEVRAALGVSQMSTPQRSLGSGPNLFGPSGRLPSPPGDGLSTVGRTKVRAGIRLEPLQASNA